MIRQAWMDRSTRLIWMNTIPRLTNALGGANACAWPEPAVAGHFYARHVLLGLEKVPTAVNCGLLFQLDSLETTVAASDVQIF